MKLLPFAQEQKNTIQKEEKLIDMGQTIGLSQINLAMLV